MKKKMISRRDVISRSATAAGAFLAAPYLGAFANTASASTLVNDVHSQLNPTRVNRILKPQSAEQLADILLSASQQGRIVSLAGKRHAMGGQQFGTDTDLIDVTSFNKIISLAKHSGIIEVESGTIWPSIIDYSIPWGQLRALVSGMRTDCACSVFLAKTLEAEADHANCVWCTRQSA